MPLQEVRVAEIVRQLGISLGAAYRIWPRQEDFHQDLAIVLSSTRTTEPNEPAAIAATPIMLGGGTWEDTLRAGARAQFDATVGDNTFAARLAVGAAASRNPVIREAGLSRYVVAFDSFISLYGVVLNHFGRQVREPWTLQKAAMALAALGEGFALQQVYQHDIAGREAAREAFAEAVVAVATAATTPATPGAQGAARKKVSSGSGVLPAR